MFLSAIVTLSLILGYRAFIQSAVQTQDIVPTEQQNNSLEDPTLNEEDVPEIEPEPEWRSYRVQKGDVLGSILPKFGLPTTAIRTAALDIIDLANLRIGQEFRFQFQPGADTPDEIRFSLGEDDTLIIRQEGDVWTAEQEKIKFDTQMGYRRFIVESSLWKAAIDEGLRPRDIAMMAEVLQYDIDFNTEIRKGATAELLVEELWQDGEFVKLGTPLILLFINKEKEYQAIRFTNGKDITAYYDANGISRESPFLRSPLGFSRVTSNFNPKRFHPIHKTTRPHNGTDFGAKTGTPVRAVSDGVVTYAGRNGGHGKFVKVKHMSPYETSYSHLSAISVKKGQRIKKGQIVGKVGSTGASTGPHLHYQVWKNKRFVDAMKVQFPKGKKLSGKDYTAFKVQKSDVWSEFERLKSKDNPE